MSCYGPPGYAPPAPCGPCPPSVVVNQPVASHTTVEAWGRPVWKKKWLLGKWKYAGVKDIQYVPRGTTVATMPTMVPGCATPVVGGCGPTVVPGY